MAAALADAERDGDGEGGAAAGQAFLLADFDEGRDTVDCGGEVFDGMEGEGGAGEVRWGRVG